MSSVVSFCVVSLFGALGGDDVVAANASVAAGLVGSGPDEGAQDATPVPELAENEQPLPAFARLEPNVAFWMNIYRRYGSGHVVIHDRDHIDVVWRVLELPRAPTGEVDRAKTQKLVRQELDALRARLARLEQDPTPQDDDDAVALALVGGKTERLVGAAQRLRSQRGVADHFTLAMSRALQWKDEIQRVLAEEGVPVELVALPFIESMFNPYARSAVGAAGIWQLMPSTARWLGLKVSKENDERLDVTKATRAAARLLKKNYAMLGSWPLAITAYNHGHNGLKRAVAQVGSNSLVDLIDRHESSTWGFSSKNFYAGFLAAVRVYQATLDTIGTQVAETTPPAGAEATLLQ